MNTKRLAGVYSPYLDTLGGGEKYLAGAMQALVGMGYSVNLLWKDVDIVSRLEARFGMHLHGVQVDSVGYQTIVSGSAWKKYALLKNYAVLLWVADGSVPFLWGEHNILHFQVPFVKVSGQSWKNKLKLRRIHRVVCNSAFTKTVIDSEYGVRSAVVYPPTSTIASLAKEKLILSVGRFDNLLHSKRQDILIQAFKALNAPGWKLVLAGGVQHGNKQVEELHALAEGAAIEIITNPDWSTLERLYGSATCYWHAAGFEVDPLEHPEQMEHFGISTVEAMSAGAVPIVYAGGGQLEIVDAGVDGYLFTTIDELISLTRQVIADHGLTQKLSSAAMRKSQQFTMEAFTHAFTSLIG